MAASYSWLKLYYEIIDDPKMGRLPDKLWRRVIECFLLAGKNGNCGTLPDICAMAWALRTDEQSLEADLSQIAKFGILDKPNGHWHVVNFEKRQAATPDAERMLQMRGRKRYEAVTGRNAEEEVEERRGREEEEVEVDATTAAFREVIKVFENEIGTVTATTADDIKDALKDYSSEWIIAALKESARANARNWKYALAILKRWNIDGFQSKNKSNGSKGNGSKPQTAHDIVMARIKELEAQGGK